jgi:hypothetical protein
MARHSDVSAAGQAASFGKQSGGFDFRQGFSQDLEVDTLVLECE